MAMVGIPSISFLVAALVTHLIVRYNDLHGHLFNDHDVSGPQKFHTHPVPRVGGLGALAGIVIGTGSLFAIDRTAGEVMLRLLACALPALLSGLAEDITKKVSPRRRLFFTALSASLGVFLVGGIITRLGLPCLDQLLTSFALAAALTVFAVTGVTNAVNIIDGFNGLASMCIALLLLALAYVALQVGDREILLICLACVGATFGFFVWNYPRGAIFLGDGGAYFLGFLVAEIAIMLMHRNPAVSPMFPLLLCIYPIFETVFSIYRKKFLRKTSPGAPDALHLHMLIYRRLVSRPSARGDAQTLASRNAATSPYLWAMCLIGAIPAVLLWNDTLALFLMIPAYAVVYTVIYWRIVRFGIPRFLVNR